MSELVSICVPAWNYYGHGPRLIREMFESFKIQTNKKFEVIISDESKDESIKDICNEYKSIFDIKHMFFERDPSLSYAHNYINAEKHASGTIIKPLFQADFFISENVIDTVIKTHERNKICWAAYRYDHCQLDGSSPFNDRIPSYNPNVVLGVNTIGAPSACSFSSEIKEEMDTNLRMMLDCDHYFRIYNSYGPPIIVSDECYIRNRISDLEAKNERATLDNVPFDINYIVKKYNFKQNGYVDLNQSPFAGHIQ